MTGWRVARVTDGTYEQRAGAPELRLQLARDEQAPAAARRAVEGWCPPELSGGAPRRETLVLLVSEVVTNAVLHSPRSVEGPIELTARVEEELIRVMVTDPGDGFTPPEPPRAAQAADRRLRPACGQPRGEALGCRARRRNARLV